MNANDSAPTGGELRELMAWSMAALRNGKISSKDADEIARLGKAYNQLAAYRTTYLERAHSEMAAIDSVPNFAQLKRHIAADEYSLVIVEANRIRTAMKPILQQAKAQVDALRR